jgi:formylglycine-generating enzyme required for sulfatase activity
VNAVDGSIFVFVPEARCTLGSAKDDTEAEDREKPTYEVALSAWFVGKYKVTVEQFRRFTKATGYVTLAERPLPPPPKSSDETFWWPGPRVTTPEIGEIRETPEPTATWQAPEGKKGPSSRDEEPVLQAAWDDAVAYATWAGATLPSDAQWECAARWDPRTNEVHGYPWGDDRPDEKRAAFLDVQTLRPAKLLAARSVSNRSPVGAVQMAGNTREWVLDNFAPNHAWLVGQGAPRDPVSTYGNGHVVKGGSRTDVETALRAASRTRALGSDDRTSFRLAIPVR